MSKGEIINEIGEGKYRVRKLLATEKIEAELIKLNARISELAVEVPAAKLLRLQASSAVDSKAREIDLAIPNLQAGIPGAAQEIAALQSELIGLGVTLSAKKLQVSELVAENLSALKRRSQLESVDDSEETEAWCADYTLELTGEIGIVDINDEGGQGFVIQPGHDEGAAYDAARDGGLFPNIAQSGPQLFFNAALLPAVQKWRPRYRLGEITLIEGDTCTVALDDAESSAQSLPINKTGILKGTPIYYMECNGAAFQIGDRVLVRFTPSGPLVVGFEKEPVPCSLFGFVFEPAKYTTPALPHLPPRKDIYGAPYELSGALINPPIGSEGGANGAWTAIPDGGALPIQSGRPRRYGNKNWFNSEKLVISWDGPPGRAHRMDQLSSSLSGFQREWRTSPVIYHDLKIIFNLLSHGDQIDGFNRVFGAAVTQDEQDQRWLVVMASNRGSIPGQEFRAFRIAVNESMETSGQLQPLQSYQLDDGMAYQSHWYFSENGRQAVCTIVGDLEEEDKLHVDLVRYDIASGFSAEQLWTREDELGRDVHVYNETSSDIDERPLTSDVTFNRTLNTPAYKVPVYCDFVGNREVVAYESWPSVQLSHSDNYSFTDSFLVSIDEVVPARWNRNIVTNNVNGGKFSITTSDGATLFEMPYVNTFTRSVSVTTASTNYTTTISESSRERGAQSGEDLLAIDIRFEFCAVNYIDHNYSTNVTTTGSYNLPPDRASASGGISGDVIHNYLEVWQGGRRVELTEVKSEPGSKSVSQAESYGMGYTNGSFENASKDDPVYPRVPLLIGSEYLLTAAAYKSGPHSLVSVAMNYPMSFNERELVAINKVSGYSNPVSQLFGRSENDGYLICSLGLV